MWAVLVIGAVACDREESRYRLAISALERHSARADLLEFSAEFSKADAQFKFARREDLRTRLVREAGPLLMRGWPTMEAQALNGALEDGWFDLRTSRDRNKILGLDEVVQMLQPAAPTLAERWPPVRAALMAVVNQDTASDRAARDDERRRTMADVAGNVLVEVAGTTVPIETLPCLHQAIPQASALRWVKVFGATPAVRDAAAYQLELKFQFERTKVEKRRSATGGIRTRGVGKLVGAVTNSDTFVVETISRIQLEVALRSSRNGQTWRASAEAVVPAAERREFAEDSLEGSSKAEYEAVISTCAALGEALARSGKSSSVEPGK